LLFDMDACRRPMWMSLRTLTGLSTSSIFAEPERSPASLQTSTSSMNHLPRCAASGANPSELTDRPSASVRGSRAYEQEHSAAALAQRWTGERCNGKHTRRRRCHSLARSPFRWSRGQVPGTSARLGLSGGRTRASTTTCQCSWRIPSCAQAPGLASGKGVQVRCTDFSGDPRC